MSNIISTGSTYHIYDQSVSVYDKLPAHTYRVNFSPVSGFSLVEIPDMESPTEKVYGKSNRRAARSIMTYARSDRSLGILISGDKGMGKTMLMRMIATEAQQQFDLPIIIVDQNAEGIANYIATIGESIIVFDEFEKNFHTNVYDNNDQQAQFLSLFDGLDATKRMYIVTINEVSRASEYLINRPGRFHYHFCFEYPTGAEIREYLLDNNIAANQVEKVVKFSYAMKLNYDHLRSIVFELQDGSDFDDVVSDLNIKRFNTSIHYTAALTLENGQTYQRNVEQIYGDDCYFYIRDIELDAELLCRFDAINGVFTPDGMQVPLEDVELQLDVDADDNDRKFFDECGKIKSLIINIRRPAGIDF